MCAIRRLDVALYGCVARDLSLDRKGRQPFICCRNVRKPFRRTPQIPPRLRPEAKAKAVVAGRQHNEFFVRNSTGQRRQQAIRRARSGRKHASGGGRLPAAHDTK
jgi:hypothetical protein